MNSKSIGMLLLATLVVAGSFTLHAVADTYSDPGGVPRLIPFRGHLESGGSPVTSAVTIEAQIHDAATGGALLWGPETHAVTPAGGDFTLMLGTSVALPPTVLEGGDAWIAVSVDGTPLAGRQRLGSAPYALRAREAANGLPVGGVVPWWRPSPTAPVPDGFAICDGTMVVDPESPLNGSTLPDLTDRVVLGVPLARSGELGGTPGTSWTTASAGAHAHTWVTRAGLSWVSGDGRTIITWGDGLDTPGSGHYPIATTTASGSVAYNTSTTAAHSHTITPAYAGLVMLMRIR